MMEQGLHQHRILLWSERGSGWKDRQITLSLMYFLGFIVGIKHCTPGTQKTF